MQRKRTRSARKSVYQLKKVYGFRVTLCRLARESFNYETGEERNVTQFVVIKKAIVFPADIEYDTNIIRYQRHSAGFRDQERKIIFDWQDIKSMGIELNDYILYDSKTWQVSKIVDYELDTVKLVFVKHICNAPYADPLNPDMTSTAAMSQGGEHA